MPTAWEGELGGKSKRHRAGRRDEMVSPVDGVVVSGDTKPDAANAILCRLHFLVFRTTSTIRCWTNEIRFNYSRTAREMEVGGG